MVEKVSRVLESLKKMVKQQVKINHELSNKIEVLNKKVEHLEKKTCRCSSHQ